MELQSIYQVLSQVLPLLMLGLALYFVAWKPQQEKIKAHNAMLSTLKKGDHVMLSCGIFGHITAINGTDLSVSIATDTIITIEKSHVSKIITPEKKA